MTLPIATWADRGIGFDVFCQCGRTGYVSAKAASKLDTSMDLKQMAFHLSCKACGAKGGAALIVRFSIGDYYDQARDRGSLIPV